MRTDWSPLCCLLTLWHFGYLSDPRVDRTELQRLSDMVAIALCAAIGGADGWPDVGRFRKMRQEWFAKFLERPNGIPSHDTFGRVFAMFDTAEIYYGFFTDYGGRAVDGLRTSLPQRNRILVL